MTFTPRDIRDENQQQGSAQPLSAPFPWFGGKSRAAPLIWQALGDVPHFIEPFFGSGAVLLNRPHAPKTETVNDCDGFVANTWRALQSAPEEVAYWCDRPVNECLPAGTLIATPEGAIPVEQIMPGMIVYGYEDNQIVSTPVLGAQQRMARPDEFVQVGGLAVTDNHPIWTRHGYRMAKHLMAFEELGTLGMLSIYGEHTEGTKNPRSCLHALWKGVSPQSQRGEILFDAVLWAGSYGAGTPFFQLRRTFCMRLRDFNHSCPCPVYNFSTITHNYFANGVLVHNCDQHAIHTWLVAQRQEFTARLMGDPDYYDARVAGRWLYGICCWIGSGWCSGEGPWHSVDGKLVHLGDAGRGVRRKRVHLGDAGRGVRRKRVHLSHAGRGVHRKRVHLSHAGHGEEGLYKWFEALAQRLRHVRVCCGDWRRVLGAGVTYKGLGTTGILLDPPYSAEENRYGRLYACDDTEVAHAVRAWCLSHGEHPLERIVLCGYGTIHDALLAHGWTKTIWTAHGGLSNQNRDKDNQNKYRETLWMSPHCQVVQQQLALFEGGAFHA